MCIAIAVERAWLAGPALAPRTLHAMCVNRSHNSASTTIKWKILKMESTYEYMQSSGSAREIAGRRRKGKSARNVRGTQSGGGGGGRS